MSQLILIPKKIKIPKGYTVIEKGKLEAGDKVYNLRSEQFDSIWNPVNLWVSQFHLVIRKNDR
jgi:hypothetical protein